VIDLEISGDTTMDVTRQRTTQQRIKIVEAYFATKSVVLTQTVPVYTSEILAGDKVPITGHFHFGSLIQQQTSLRSAVKGAVYI
jgi:hypothetical protein